MDQVKQKVINTARTNHLNFVIDCADAGQNFVEFTWNGRRAELKIKAVYDRQIRNFLQDIKGELKNTNYDIDANSSVYSIDHMYFCEAVIYDIANWSEDHGCFNLR